MGISYGFVLILALLALIISAATAMYTAAYKRRINQVLLEPADNETERHRPMMSPLKFLLTLILSIAGAYLLIVTIAFALFRTQHSSVLTVTADSQASILFCHDMMISDSLLSAYSPDEDIPGYTRSEHTDGSFRFAEYTINDGGVRLFPEMLVYVEYTGTDTDDIMFMDASCNSDTYGLQTRTTDFFPTNKCRSSWLVLDGYNYAGELVISCNILPEDTLRGEITDADIENSSRESGSCFMDISLDQYIPDE